MRPLYGSVRWIVRSYFRLFHGLKVQVAEVPEGGAIIASNHLSHLDPPVVGVAWPEEIHYLARDTLFKKRFLNWLLRKLNAHPIVRGGADLGSLRQVLQFLGEGKKIVIFPEGTRSRTGELGEGQPGVAMLALRARCPVIPARIWGTDQILPPGAKHLKSGKMKIVFGPPLHPDEFAHLGKREAQRAMTEALMAAIAQLATDTA